jgi:cystathionine beta-lyase/cystathionine gamma-synthase
LEKYRNEVTIIFNQLAHHNHQRLVHSQKDWTFTYREFSLMLQRYKFFCSFEDITMKDVIEQYAQALPLVGDDTLVNLDLEVCCADLDDIS